MKVIGVREVQTRLNNLSRFAIQVQNVPSLMLVTPVAIAESVKVAKEKFATPPNTPKYPLRWASDKQRKYVMAKLRKENNLPYRRTGRFAQAWASSQSPSVIEIANTAQGDKGQFLAPFIIGTLQQPFHKDTGWTQSAQSVERAIVEPIFKDVRKQAIAGIEKSKYG